MSDGSPGPIGGGALPVNNRSGLNLPLGPNRNQAKIGTTSGFSRQLSSSAKEAGYHR